MTTEFGDAKKKTRETNPLGLSNTFHISVGLVNLLAGCGLAYMLTQDALELHLGLASGLLMSAALMVLGLNQVAQAWRDDRFRIHPEDIGDISVTEKFENGGKPNLVGYLNELLNSGVVPPKTPDGALLNKLYIWFPKLEFAPEVIRWHAETQALRIARLLVAILGFGLAALFAKPDVFVWIVPVYLLLSVRPLSVIRSLKQGAAGQQQLSRPSAPTPTGSVLVLLFSVFAPILVPVLVAPLFASGIPAAPWSALAVVSPTLVAMATMLAASALFLVSLKAQTADLSATGVGHVIRKDLEVPNLGQGLFDAISSHLPLPRKTLVNEMSKEGGEFKGRLIVETEPALNVVGSGVSRLSALREAWVDRQHRPLLTLGGVGAFAGILATLLAVLYTRGGGVPLLLTALALFSTSQFSLLAARGLWNRVDFRSTIYKVQYKGGFRQAQRVAGNSVTGSGTLTETTTAIDHVEVVVSVAELQSVAFAKKGGRYIQCVDLKPDECERIISIVEDFNRDVVSRKMRAYGEEGLVRQLVQRESSPTSSSLSQQMIGAIKAADTSESDPPA